MLSIRRITKRYGTTVAVDAADLEVAPGELVCLLGPSGCGKSTLLRVIAGLADADAGSILIEGQDVTTQAANRRPTAMVFQSHALWTHMSVARNVSFGLRVRGMAKAEIDRRVADALALVGLSGFEARLPTELSGGQAQRVALARCLVVEPKVLLMDEPFSALDAHLRMRLRDELKALQHRLGLTIVFVTHDQEEAMEIADRIVVMNDGRFEQTGRPAELYAEPRTSFVAGFIGLMNTAPAEARGGRLKWLGLDLACDVADGAYDGSVRPEDLDLADGVGVGARLQRLIDLGSVRRLVAATEDGTVLKAQTVGGRDLDLGRDVRLAPKRLMLYRDGRLVGAAHPISA